MVARRCCVLLLLAGLLAHAAFRPPVAYACSCAIREDPQAGLHRSAAVFAGNVVAVRRAFPSFRSAAGLGSNLVTFDVARVWKGPTQRRIIIATQQNEAACGYTFDHGHVYIVYATRSAAGLETSICDRTRLLDEAQEDVAVLGAGRLPDPHRPEMGAARFVVPTVLIVAVAILVAAGLAVARKRRSATGV